MPDQSFIIYTILPIIIIPIAENDSMVESGLHGVEYIIIIDSRTINSGIQPIAFFSVFLAFISFSVSDHLLACRAAGRAGFDIFIGPTLGALDQNLGQAPSKLTLPEALTKRLYMSKPNVVEPPEVILSFCQAFIRLARIMASFIGGNGGVAKS